MVTTRSRSSSTFGTSAPSPQVSTVLAPSSPSKRTRKEVTKVEEPEEAPPSPSKRARRTVVPALDGPPKTPRRNTKSKETKEATATKLEPVIPDPLPPISSTPLSADPILSSQPAPAQRSLGPVSTTIKPKLSFRWEDARKHLEGVDPRFGVLMDRLRCKPFQPEDGTEECEEVDVFRSLASSILGQQACLHIHPMPLSQLAHFLFLQVSWLAARAITYRFVRLFFPDLPETMPKPDDPSTIARNLKMPFPSPYQVVTCPLPEGVSRVQYFRTAGLSMRKAEYVIELAERFSDGRLEASVLAESSDEEVLKMLCDVRGIGKWTVQMFEIFSLKRADVMPAGDLGIQKGLVRWFSTPGPPKIQARKLPTPSKSSGALAPTTTGVDVTSNGTVTDTVDVAAVDLPVLNPGNPPVTPRRPRKQKLSPNGEGQLPTPPPTVSPSMSGAVTPDTPVRATNADIKSDIDERQRDVEIDYMPVPFPKNTSLTPDIVKARLSKKIKGNNYLSPQEMEELTEAWRPFRSVGIWYLWSVADGGDSSL